MPKNFIATQFKNKPVKVEFYTKENKKVFFKGIETTKNKIYEALMVEKETRQKFKKAKPQGQTNTEFLKELMKYTKYQVH